MTEQTFKGIIAYIKDIIAGTEFEGHVFAVGGCVRDQVMGHEIKDIDMAVSLPCGGVKFAEFMESSGHTYGHVVTYPTYGTAMFRLKEFPEEEIECVQTRKEQYKDRNSRNPETAYGTIKEDCMRRDLTINSLYLNVTTGEVLDLTGRGLDDIKNHVIRTTATPVEIYSDDPLRMLRVVRFSSRYGWDIEENTYKALSEEAHRLGIISQERITDEFCKMLTCDNPVMAVKTLMETGLMHYVMPEFEATYKMGQNAYHFGTVYAHTLMVLDNVPTKLNLRVAAFMHDIGKTKTRTVDENGNAHFLRHEEKSAEMCEEILRRMKFPVDFIRDVTWLCKNHMRTKQWGDECDHMKLKRLRKLQYDCKTLDRFGDLMTLIHADNISHAPKHCLPNQVGIITNTTMEMVNEGNAMFGYKLPVNGSDVMEYLGIGPGPEVRQILRHLTLVACSEPKMSREKALKYAKGGLKDIHRKAIY